MPDTLHVDSWPTAVHPWLQRLKVGIWRTHAHPLAERMLDGLAQAFAQLGHEVTDPP